ncbi:putative endo-beta- - protein [Botryosphaeria dothidea]|uniref:glucan endo-1,6-beta-glucosidase n=1 Tax=Botryosphaeria dothidea TaxID=55169 RepID=A0A8H4IPI5_9PEZI|nr:putative endo-beta- - protein [Botryosphaeria dothidea]
MFFHLLALASSAALTAAWLPDAPPSGVSLGAFQSSGTKKIRGVNAGSQYIVEPWMAGSEWNDNMKCNGAQAERQCVEQAYGGDMNKASNAWQGHWDRWITQDDIKTMVSYGLNTIRIPVGFWMKEDILNQYEHYPKGGFAHLQNFCGWASDAGMYIIIDLHGLPGRQKGNDAFTGDYQDSTGFYQSDYESGRAYEFLKWMTENIHHNSTLRNVGAIELVNEPLREDSGNTRWMVEHYYPSAIDAIRGVENELGIDDEHRLNIIMMDDLWASGPEATSSLSATQRQHLLFDDHNYQGSPIDNCGGAKSCAISYTCSRKSGQGNRVTAQSPKVVGEWSMKLNQLGGQELQNKDFFKQYFAAQQQQYEKTLGWIYWSWKTEHFSDYLQWSYKDAVEQGIIDKDLNAMLRNSPC